MTASRWISPAFWRSEINANPRLTNSKERITIMSDMKKTAKGKKIAKSLSKESRRAVRADGRMRSILAPESPA